MTQHTPGPWRLEINKSRTIGNIWGPNGEHVENADLGGSFLIGGKAEFERELADLHIKAAALDLLEIAEQFIEAIRTGKSLNPVLEKAFIVTKQARGDA